jgi:hypothetical protein
MDNPFGPGLDIDARPAHLFECGDAYYAVSLDAAGSNLPVPPDAAGWRLKQTFMLGVREPLPFPMDPEPLLRGIYDRGYYLWRDANSSKPHGTSQ